MTLGQSEFTLLASVLAAYLIFTPEPLVPLWNLIAWAMLTWIAWYGYVHWETSFWTPAIIKYFTGYSASSFSGMIRDRALCWRTQVAAAIRREDARIRDRASTLVTDILGRLRYLGIASDSGVGSGFQRYYAILVTTPPVHAYEPVSDQSYNMPDDTSQFSGDSIYIGSIPAKLSYLRFRRHFALVSCLQMFGDRLRRLKEKFHGQLFSGYCDNTSEDPRAAT
ncbi:hypothetical protein AK830_g600 [Neonectria ditissima]|uniref:Uncharacterized protein n=1 Tax=Neonectria ditissima TaxID=78410 RepID=A0A0P7B727_9HYPO|nr:hypothetical protein AK830_g600 [Neonectria ditissima]